VKASSTDRLQKAIGLHQQGRLREAEDLYRQILASEPSNFDALHLLGVVRHQQGNGTEALGFIERALKRNPGSVRALSNRGLVLHAMGRNDEAIQSFDQALAVDPDSLEALSNRAHLLYRLGRHEDAIGSFDRMLALRPDYAEGLILRGNALAQVGRYGDALTSYERALKIRPSIPEVLSNRGNALEALKRYEEALASYDQALALRPDYAEAHNNRAGLLATLKRHEEALAGLDRALAIKPDYEEAHNNRGNVLSALGRNEEALASYERALAIQPDYAEAINNCGNVLSALDRHEDAIVRFDQALALAPGYAAAWYNRGNALSALRRYEDAIASYDQALAIAPHYAEALDNCGNALLNLNRHEEALESFERAIALNPANPATHNNRGSALSALKRHELALASYQQAIALQPNFLDALSNRGNVFKDLRRHEEALASFEQALAIDPEHVDASVGMAEVVLSVCDWTRTEALAGELAARVTACKPTVAPFTLLAYCDDPLLHRKCAETFVADRMPVRPTPLWTGPAVRRDKIRVAYLSADFHRHATAYLVAELFELHDRSRFDILGLAFDWDDGSDVRRRLVESFDQFYDVRTRSDRDVARLLLSLEVDIAIDLKGHTGDSRLGIFAHRPAPVQASYLGYPGTIGADFIDYIITDPVVAPLDHEPFYVEKIAQLPDCYQVNDRKRTIAERVPGRKEAGLPPTGFVFCCFNNNYKITAPVFDVWMRLMQAAPGSVLWLLRDNVGAERNLRREAQRRGIDPVRLVFAGRTTLADHLARHRLADLFLDTLPYNAHTTASDALWAGVPLITCQGKAFAGRVGASLLRSVGLPELVTESLADYEAAALRLATDPAALAEVRQKLANNRETCPLFDADRFRRHIEAAYTTMWETWQRGEPPRSFAVEAEQRPGDGERSAAL
jgi:predicted O-linked N-acetylglucosamine transferase (SPINDLY family)